MSGFGAVEGEGGRIIAFSTLESDFVWKRWCFVSGFGVGLKSGPEPPYLLLLPSMHPKQKDDADISAHYTAGMSQRERLVEVVVDQEGRRLAAACFARLLLPRNKPAVRVHVCNRADHQDNGQRLVGWGRDLRRENRHSIGLGNLSAQTSSW